MNGKMAQEKVTSYFPRRKNSNLQPSKRRKVLRTADFDSTTIQDAKKSKFIPDPATESVKVSLKKSVNIPLVENEKPAISAEKEIGVSQKDTKKTRSTRSSIKSSSKPKSTSQSTSKRTTRSRKTKEVPAVTTIADLFAAAGGEQKESCEDQGFDEVDGPILKKTVTYDLASAFIDDHAVTPPSSPRKRPAVKNDDAKDEISRKRGRPHKTTRKDHLAESLLLTPEPAYDFDRHANKQRNRTTSVRKKLVLQGTSDSETSKTEFGTTKSVEPSQQEKVKPTKSKVKTVQKSVEKSKSDEIAQNEPETAPPTPLRKKVLETVGKSPVKTAKPNVQECSQQTPVILEGKMKKLRDLEALKQSIKAKKNLPSPAEMKTKLSKCGKLAELQEQLAKLNENKQKLKKTREDKVEKEDARKTVEPAYQRYHTLAQPAPPTLSLPFKYKLLSEMFRSTDTVVSMLHNRSEMCTFSKLKTAVENMVRKAFEHKALGQMRRVFPAAYVFRQEKGVPQFGGKSLEYQLTVEPNLEEKSYNESLESVLNKSSEEIGKKNQQAKQSFSASNLLGRRNIFHNELVNIVKKHHKEFLSKLDRPMSIPEDKLTRWHPKFNVDAVPDISPAPLPEAPNIQKFVTARDVMQHTTGKLPKRVEVALSKVAAASKKEEEKNQPTKPEKKPATGPGLKGVSQSLLDRIRAREAKKTELTMTRTPVDEQNLQILSRLPDLVRIIRTIFITEKKPAVLLDVVCEKMSDSYRTGMSSREVEKHMDMMVELLPDWIQIVKTIKGKFIKINKNQDIAVISEKLKKILKEKETGSG